MTTLCLICFCTLARAAKCWNFGAIFTPKNRSLFNIIQTDFCKKIWNLETICNNAPERFFRNQSSNWIYLASKLVKKRKIWRENFFLLNVCGFCREKNSKNSGRDGKILVTWFSQYSCLKVQNFAIIRQNWHATLPEWCIILFLTWEITET